MAFVELQPPRTFPLINPIRIRLLLCQEFDLPWLIDCLVSSKSLGSGLMDALLTGSTKNHIDTRTVNPQLKAGSLINQQKVSLTLG